MVDLSRVKRALLTTWKFIQRKTTFKGQLLGKISAQAKRVDRNRTIIFTTTTASAVTSVFRVVWPKTKLAGKEVRILVFFRVNRQDSIETGPKPFFQSAYVKRGWKGRKKGLWEGYGSF